MDFYTNEEGFQVKTSEYLKKRKSCCKCSCLHCPYGHTLKTLGLTFSKSHDLLISSNIIKYGTEVASFSSFLFDEANISPKVPMGDFFDVFLKDIHCGVIIKLPSGNFELYLKNHFKDQGLTLELVKDYLGNQDKT